MDQKHLKKLFKTVATGNAIKMLDMIDTVVDRDILKLRDDKGRQLVHVAAKKGRVVCLLHLIKYDYEIIEEKCFKGNNVLHYACISGSLPCIVAVLEKGSNLRALNFDGKTPLDLLPGSKQKLLGRILRKAEQRQKIILPDAEKEGTGMVKCSLKPLLGDIPLISEEDVSLSLSMELAKGPNMTCCQGQFQTIPIMVKYNNSKIEMKETPFSLKNEIVAFKNIGNHPNLLELLGVMLKDEQKIILIFEFPNFGFLHRVLFQSKLKMDSIEILHIGRDISNALCYIHSRGYLHCAVASYSVILSKTLQAKICNLNYMQKKTQVTSISHIPCLYPYMANKQRQGYPCNESNDVHGIGVILYECATSCRMQNIESAMNIQNNALGLYYKLKQIPKTHAGAVATLIEACMSDVYYPPTSLKLFQWLDAILGGRFATVKPYDMKKEKLSTLRLS